MSRPIPPAIVTAAQQAQRDWRVPASVSLAQWALESTWGDDMPVGSLNPFGIKARAGEPAVVCLTHECVHGQTVQVHAAFRRFDTLGQAFDRHAELLATSPIYAPAMHVLPDLGGFVRLMAAHYATDPDYARKLLALISGSNLTRFDVAPPSTAPSGHDVLRAALSSPGDHL